MIGASFVQAIGVSELTCTRHPIGIRYHVNCIAAEKRLSYLDDQSLIGTEEKTQPGQTK